MKHSFNPNIHNLCAICGRTDLDHTDSAQCEACPIIGPCEVIGPLLLCAECYDKEIRILPEEPLSQDPRANRITALVNTLGKELPLDSRKYFVNEVTSIVDIESQVRATGIENPQYEFARIIDDRIFQFRKRLFELKNEAIELRIEIDSDQKYLNHIVPTLREEEREKFKAYDISYQPTTALPATTANKPRQSASDKALASYAAMLGISIEQARISMTNAMKNVTGNKCTCSETPGLCKVHPKG